MDRITAIDMIDAAGLREDVNILLENTRNLTLKTQALLLDDLLTYHNVHLPRIQVEEITCAGSVPTHLKWGALPKRETATHRIELPALWENELSTVRPPKYDTPTPRTTPTENFKMTILTITYANGRDVSNMTVEQYLDDIKQLDSEIKRLKDMGIDSVTVNASITELEEQKARLVALLDEHHAPKEEPDTMAK